MPEFRYVARNAAGLLLDGTVSSEDRASAIRQVERQGATPIKIEMVGGAAAPTPAAAPTKKADAASATADVPVTRLGHTQQHLFTEQLAHLLGAGMTLDEALGVLVRRLKHPQLQSLSRGLHKALVEGRSLSQALRDYPRIFSP